MQQPEREASYASEISEDYNNKSVYWDKLLGTNMNYVLYIFVMFIGVTGYAFETSGDYNNVQNDSASFYS